MDANRAPDEIYALPLQSTPFVGRQTELAQITRLLNDPACRLLTLVGPGGIGKTRLAIEAAGPHRAGFADGVHLIVLQPLASPDFVVPAVAEALRFQFFPGGEPRQQLLDYLHGRSLLLVLDNFEHLLDSAELVSAMLAHAPGLKVLATSRERLNLREEWVLDVTGLPVPVHETETEIGDYGAVQLFVQNAQRVQVGFTLTDAQKPAVIRICRLVGGMPLGIELAAAWVRVLPCEEIAAEIERSLDLLVTSTRNVPPRHRTMRAALEHSWNLLSPAERDVFRRLSVFRGGFRKEAAQSVAGASMQTLSALVDKTLVRVDRNGRYGLHELLHQYAYEKLAETDEARTIFDRHRDYFLDFAERAGEALFGVHQADWFERVETELSNVRAAIAWSIEKGDIPEALRLAGSLYRFWAERNHHAEGYERLMAILAQPEAGGRTAIRAMALNAVGYIQWFAGNNADVRRLLDEAIIIAREVDDPRELARAVRTLGPVLYALGEYAAAAQALEETLELARKADDHYGMAWSLMFLGDVALQKDNTEQGQRCYQESIDLLRELEDRAFLAYPTRRLAIVMTGYANYEPAKVLCQESLQLNVALNDRRGMASSMIGLAGLAIAQGRLAHGAQLLGAADRLLREIGAHLLLTDQVEYARHLETVRAQLDLATFQRAWAEGKALTTEQAVARALEQPELHAAPALSRQPVHPAHDGPLTAREMEILHLIELGLSNRAIAERLIVAVGTVKWHVSQICSKLGAENRVQALARARALNLLG